MTSKRIITLRDFPSVEELLQSDELSCALGQVPRPLAAELTRQTVARLKDELKREQRTLSRADLLKEIRAGLEISTRRNLSRVINATGIVIHTNLGRAPLSDSLFERMRETVTGYGNVEFDLNTGRRGGRGEACEEYLALLSGAEAGTAVNNCAAALFLILNSLAARKSVVISRGELVQIGGGFRIPDILKRSGARLCEVGTTNITTLADYESAIDERTALILRVHRSNFAQSGFTQDVALDQLVALGERRNIPVINDLGSGVFVSTQRLLGYAEPTVQESVRAGAVLTCFSGDKMLGGCQAGLIVGQKTLVARIKKNPLFRTMRVDKITFAIVEQLLTIYLNGTEQRDIRLWQMLSLKPAELHRRAVALIEALGKPAHVSIEDTAGFVGGGALPERAVPSVAVVIDATHNAERLLMSLRRCSPPVIGRIESDRLVLDLRTVDESDVPHVVTALRHVLGLAE